uniref:Rhomboid-like protein 14, mitochondrial isoform X2 n=1 Tax=Elaeis guineensis var. tenera TaxID=51953 RepID=A0A6J0PEU3_ELAGV|nr:rhomboid-like protein 14, mitochondrial isoform X2 [Elaeis guineensis]
MVMGDKEEEGCRVGCCRCWRCTWPTSTSAWSGSRPSQLGSSLPTPSSTSARAPSTASSPPSTRSGSIPTSSSRNAYYHQYAVGFSGVLFAMKVVLNAQSDDYAYVHGMIIPARHAAWAELILIQLFVPGVSFLGHLGGILAGLLYLRLRGSYSGPDPVTAMIRNVARIVSWPLRFVRGLFGFQRHRISGRGRIGRSPPRGAVSGVWRCPVCTYDNSASVDVCEMCNTIRRGNGFGLMRTPDRTSDLSVEELRRRRLERFDR